MDFVMEYVLVEAERDSDVVISFLCIEMTIIMDIL